MIEEQPPISGARTLMAASVAMLACYPIFVTCLMVGSVMLEIINAGRVGGDLLNVVLLYPLALLLSLLGAVIFPLATGLAFLLLVLVGSYLARRYVFDSRIWSATGGAIGLLVATVMAWDVTALPLSPWSLVAGPITGVVAIHVFRRSLLWLSRESGYRLRA